MKPLQFALILVVFVSFRVSNLSAQTDREEKIIKLAGVECVVESYITDYIPETKGKLISITRKSDGCFIYDYYLAKIDGDCEKVDKAMDFFTDIHSGNELEPGDFLPTYTYQLEVDWKKDIHTPTCIWKSQKDWGVIKATLRSPDCKVLITTQELTSIPKLVAAAKDYVRKSSR